MKPITVIRQRHGYDCGTAALAMLLDVSYGDSAAAVRKIVGEDKHNGTGVRDLQRAAKLLGHTLKTVSRSTDYLEGATGILGVRGNGKNASIPLNGHWVIYKAGVIVDPAGTVWPNAHDYLRCCRARPCTLLVAESES